MWRFKSGDQVEVCCKDEGFNNSFYPATIISEINTNEYIVQYNTLLTADELHPHREFLSAVDLRPVPPAIAITKFDRKDEVDAYANDGWWRGKITKKLIGRGRATRYYVTFQGNGDVEVSKYWSNELRIHQDWISGNWFSSKKIFQ
ncbi:hypothetical protein SOVF_186880 [Spinacia oleracea]|uniref:Protein AGENET DOMAIN (AGD)-CONTAINING P1 n=1 Tax=Spinacia oleracea TaxID=3562 RepID=A0A9R0I4G1_SPIOL|nr:protein AGENET DOMAIN (AGD)-CONTAINING P1 [Spinacia oleracea]KNA05814.1 hypothetical protein SOVF_186880 [Spinacia oleracea]